ncbi:uncharacterized protein ATC70_009872 [Mucor velutinosus]|uniref:Rpr2-domain-containing protein n=1 Tax=Mucor velutinosus TaxID=708070 RepID=A0AAN7HV94_9FUNG|nr:hypothetical protein ATC70_009872 [Mucor velutinosus]
MSTTTKSLQTHQQTSRLDFLFEAGHTMLSQCPSLSRYYMNEFQNTLTEYELTAHKPIARLSCKSCGQINVPGLNHRIEIIHQQSKKQNKTKKTIQSKNTIKSTCLTCGNTSLYHGSNKKKMPKLNMQQEPVIATVKPITTTPATTSVGTPTAEPLKKKKNKGKKNNLKALLNKQQNSGNSSSNGTGGLGDFLSSL